MVMRNRLFFIIFISVLITGCGILPSGREARAPNTSVAAASALGAARMPSRHTEVLFQALAAAGAEYRYGGISHQSGFDCSGLVAFVYREAYGLALPHNALAQSRLGDAIERSELQPGDLVFFNTLQTPHSHVGIYLGEGRFIHAPKTGAVVRTEKLAARYWATRFDGARRIAPGLAAAD